MGRRWTAPDGTTENRDNWPGTGTEWYKTGRMPPFVWRYPIPVKGGEDAVFPGFRVGANLLPGKYFSPPVGIKRPKKAKNDCVCPKHGKMTWTQLPLDHSRRPEAEDFFLVLGRVVPAIGGTDVPRQIAERPAADRAFNAVGDLLRGCLSAATARPGSG